jgi:hypothetical protein
MRRTLLIAATLLAVVGCKDSVDPGSVDLTGSWSATPDALGVATMDLDLVETDGDLSGTGQYTASTSLNPDGTFTLNGIHIGGEVNVTLMVTPDGGQVVQQNLTGHVDDEDHFILVFPTENPKRVTFTRR